MNNILSRARVLQDDILSEFNSRKSISCWVETNSIGGVSVKINRMDWVDDIHGYKFRGEICFYDFEGKNWEDFLKEYEHLKSVK